MKTKTDYKSILIEINILTIAIAIIAVAVYFFLVPSHTSISSMSGLGIVLSNFVPLPLSAITMILNVVLLIIGFFTCGKEFGLKTVYTSVMLPVFLGIFENIFPNTGSITNSQELDVLCYILVVSVGLSILFNRNASSGGLDIVAKIINKYFHMELGKAMSLSGMCVALSAALVYDKKTVVLSVLGTYFNGIVLDHFIFDHNIKRRVCIITKKEEELRQFIVRVLAAKRSFDKDSRFQVSYTRTSDTYPSLSQRAKLANNKNADMFLCVHINSASASAHGTETLWSKSRNSATQKKGLTSKTLATAMQSAAVAATGFTNRGLVDRPNLYVLKHTNMPACLIEYGFISNRKESARMKANTSAYGKALYKAVVNLMKKQGKY